MRTAVRHTRLFRTPFRGVILAGAVLQAKGRACPERSRRDLAGGPHDLSLNDLSLNDLALTNVCKKICLSGGAQPPKSTVRIRRLDVQFQKAKRLALCAVRGQW